MAELEPRASTNNPQPEEDDDTPTLSAHTIEALKQFLSEQNATVSEPNIVEDNNEDSKVSLVTEDWRLSQFWYEPETAQTVANEVLFLSRNTRPCRVACIACPTLYVYLKYGSDFTFYDYNQPEELPSELKNAFQVVVADPPYLSKECLEKVTQTVSFLTQPGQSSLLLLTGAVQKDRVAELLNMQPCIFRPQHSSKLGNEFRLFTNYNPGTRLGGWDQ